jgi:ubiquinone/menaquinone biosynthesis C-methylase UbiE
MNRSYEAFASEPEYLELNRRFIETLFLAEVDTVLDLACGTGTLTYLIHETVAASRNHDKARKPEPAIVGVDISRESLELARTEWNGPHPKAPAVNFVQATVERLPLASGTFDLVIIGNAIQLFDDKEGVIRDVHRVLRGRGVLAFNTSFYARTFVPGTERFYLNWVQEAYRYVADQARRSQGDRQGPRRRPKDQSRPAFSRPWLSKEEYEHLLIRNGFAIENVVERVALLTEHSFQSIGSYAGLASVLLSGYPPELASEALEKSAGRALASIGMDAIPRNWIEFIARRE